MMAQPPYPVLAGDDVRHVGDAVAFIVAETDSGRARCRRGDRGRLRSRASPWSTCAPRSSGRAARLAASSRRISPSRAPSARPPRSMPSSRKPRIAWRLDIVNNRLVTNYMEPRAAIGEYDAASGRFTLTTSSQGVHGLQGTLAGLMGIDAGKAARAHARRRRRLRHEDHSSTANIRWCSKRRSARAGRCAGCPTAREHFLGDAQGRDNLVHAEMALDKDGRFLAMRVDTIANLGAYLSQFGPYIPFLGISMATGTYDIPKLHARMRGVYTNTQPVDAYRGAGRPEAAYLLERLVDACAAQLGIPREEIRARNFVKPSQMPYKTQTDRTYDVGDFEGAMRQALRKADVDGLRGAPRRRPRRTAARSGSASRAISNARPGARARTAPSRSRRTARSPCRSARSRTGRGMRPPMRRSSRTFSTSIRRA